MKKFLSVLMALVLVLTAAAALADVPSKTTSDLSPVTGVETTGAASSDFSVTTTEDAAVVTEEVAALYAFVNNETAPAAPIAYFPAEVQADVAAALPEGTDLNTLQLNDFITLQATNYTEEIGDVVVKVDFVTEYKVGQQMVGLLGLYDAEGNVEWVVVKAEVKEDGAVAVTIPQAEMAKFAASNAVALTILSVQ